VEELIIMQKKRYILIFLFVSILANSFSCSLSSTVNLTGKTINKAIKLNSSTKNGASLFTLNLKNFALENGEVTIHTVDYGYDKINDSNNINLETYIPYISCSYPEDANFNIEFNDNGISVFTDKNVNYKGNEVRFDVYASINNIVVNGALPIKIYNTSATDFSLLVNGATTFKTENPLTLNNFSANINGAAYINLSGTSDYVGYVIDGTGTIDSMNLKAKEANITIDGTGTAKLSVIEKLDAYINGTGSIIYYGNPTVTKKIDGLGSIKKGD
jgi:Protein of unknown function (DUF2807).